ncbi:hypothetical protein BH23PLA1_BH23PLA1_13920 [soil metagenome]
MAIGKEIDVQVYESGAITAPQQLNRFVPTVFLALGGSGKEVLMRLRKRFYDRDVRAEPPFVRYLFIDTDSSAFLPGNAVVEDYTDLQPRPDEQVSCIITEVQFHRVFDALEHRVDSAHLAWLKPGMRNIGPQALVDGAGTHRQFGRLAFFLYYEAIRTKLQSKIDEILKNATQDPSRTVDPSRVEVVIVTSLAGGTGSGMFLDTSHLVRDILEQSKYNQLASKHVTVVGFLPTLWEQDQPGLYPRLQQNSYAALLELEYYGTPRTGDELFLVDEVGQAADRPGTGFHVTWNGQDRYLRGPAWGSCFLIDNTNDLTPNAPLPRSEVLQMVADYLFLDFEQHLFAVAQRSARSNLVQYKDRWHATWVRRGAGGSAPETALINTDVVYGTQNGCGFSTFGLAEIEFDLEKLYQAAGYRLASHLIRSRWIGQEQRYKDDDYRDWVRQDLGEARGRPDQPTPPSFRTESLIRGLLTGREGCWLDVLQKDLDALNQVPPEQGLAQLRRILKKHEANLEQGGPARQTVAQNLATLRGTPRSLGPLRERLRFLAMHHLAEHGAIPTLRLLKMYQKALAQAREALQEMPRASLASNPLPRLQEAGEIGRIVRRRAQQIEYPRARTAVASYLKARYNRVVAEMAEPRTTQPEAGDPASLLTGLNRYIGSDSQRPSPDLSALGTLFDLCNRSRDYLEKVCAQLDERFRHASREDDQEIKRKRSLSTGWDDRKYDEKINEALVLDVDAVGPGPGGPDPFTIHWERFEAKVLEQLRAKAAPPDVYTRADFLAHWLQHESNPGDQGRVMERLAEACRAVLRNGGLDLKDVEHGNAVDLLMARDTTERQAQIDRLVATAAPYLPMRGHQTIVGLKPAYSNLYGRKPGEHSPNTPRAGNKAVIDRMVAEIAAYRTSGEGGQISAPLEAEDSSLLIVREMAGFPLQYYSGLEQLQQAYRNTLTPPTNSNDQCHIDYHESWRDLPDIWPIDHINYTRIREHIDHVLYALMLGFIVWEENEFRVKVPNRLGGAPDTYSMGVHIHRMIKYACEDESIRNHLMFRWTEWSDQATTKHWACLLTSALKTFHAVKGKVIKLDQVRRQAPRCATHSRRWPIGSASVWNSLPKAAGGPGICSVRPARSSMRRGMGLRSPRRSWRRWPAVASGMFGRTCPSSSS